MSRSTAAAFDTRPSNVSSTAHADASTEQPSWSEDKNPTRPLPMFRLEEEARRLDQAAAMAALVSEGDSTLSVSAADNAKLLSSHFSGAPGERMPSPTGEPANSDDEPTLDAPVPSSPEVISAIAAMSSPRPVRVTARPPALTSLVFTRPAPPRSPRASVAPAAVISQLPKEPLAFPRSAPSLVMSTSEFQPAPPSTPPALIAPPSGSHRIAPERAQTARDRHDTEDGRRSEPTLMSRRRKRHVQTYVVAGIWAMALSLIALLMFMATSA
jgi:hypothetical protein